MIIAAHAFDKRMLKAKEAATYTGMPVSTFKAICPVPPFELRPGHHLWDKHDLDNWIESAKCSQKWDRDQIVDRLA